MKFRLIAVIVTFLLMTIVSATEIPMIDIEQTVTKTPIAEDVSMDDAIESLIERANELQIKLVGHQRVSETFKRLGLPNVRRMEIFQFCKPQVAKLLLENNISMAAYMPCRIALVEDQDGRAWFVTVKLDLFLKSAKLPEEVLKLGIQMQNNLQEMIEAGANGDL
jgi:uncharacterized protein (DUF302 family)